jgi:hypothetical protein
MGGAGADHNHVGGFEEAARAVGVEHGDLPPGLECDARACRKTFLNFNSGDFAGRTGELGEDGGVVARADSSSTMSASRYTWVGSASWVNQLVPLL